MLEHGCGKRKLNAVVVNQQHTERRLSKTGVLYSGSKQAIKDETKRLLEETGTVGVILGGDCTVPSDIDHERFIWVREAADEFMGLLTDKSIRAGR